MTFKSVTAINVKAKREAVEVILRRHGWTDDVIAHVPHETWANYVLSAMTVPQIAAILLGKESSFDLLEGA